jgi:hypothetical protein
MHSKAAADQPVNLMAIRFDRPISSAARFSRHFGAFALVLSVAVLIAHRFGGLATPYLILVLLVSVGCAILATLLAAIGLRSLWMTGAEGGLNGCTDLRRLSAGHRRLCRRALFHPAGDL